MKKNLTELVFVLDRSGSMSGLEKDTIGGFNSMLGRQKERYGWEFLFLGANIDAIETAGRFGIQPSRAVNYECDSAGTQLNFQVVSDTVRAPGRVPATCRNILTIRPGKRRSRRITAGEDSIRSGTGDKFYALDPVGPRLDHGQFSLLDHH